MARPFLIEIQETAQELESRLKRSHTRSQTERLQMLWWLKTRQVIEKLLGQGHQLRYFCQDESRLGISRKKDNHKNLFVLITLS
jgi:hypothetical protein